MERGIPNPSNTLMASKETILTLHIRVKSFQHKHTVVSAH